jgi:hypothetical protein
MRATLIIGALLILSLLVMMPSGLAFAAKDQSMGKGGSAQIDKPKGLYTQSEAQRSGMEFETGNEFPLRVPDVKEGRHLRKSHSQHFLSMEGKSARRHLEAMIRTQDEVSGYSF